MNVLIGAFKTSVRYITRLALGALALSFAAQMAAAQTDRQCQAVVAVGGTEWAENYPLPLSLRRNLVLLVKTEMIKSGEYKDEELDTIDAVYHDRFRDAVAVAQAQRGWEPTGCLTWDVVRAYDPKGR